MARQESRHCDRWSVPTVEPILTKIREEVRASCSAQVAAPRYPKAESSAASAALPCRALVHAVDRPYPLRTVFVPSAVKRCRWQQHATGACDASDGSNHGNRLRRTTPADHHVLRHGGVKRSLHTARSGRAGRRIAAFHACCANEIK